jgi:quercetin dioxygenase-like cupin family protein
MAEIILEPGETFEHSHAQASTTMLLQGQGILELDDQRHQLVAGDKVFIRPNARHILRNTGKDVLRIECGHRPG